MTIDVAARHALLFLARDAIESAVRGNDARTRPARRTESSLFRERRGAFVTLEIAGALRGCIGRIEPDAPLSEMLPAVAVLSATRDPRFPPVTAGELAALHIEISLLTPPTRIADPAAIRIGRHGLIVSARGHRGLLLPQVAVEYGWTVGEFLAQTCIKASLPRDAWREPDTELHVFETEIVAE